MESGRFLGVWVDRKLNWSAHCKAVLAKLTLQKLALTRLAAKTWGVNLIKAREVYTKVIRSAIAYGASAFHIPSEGDKERGIVKKLAKQQNAALRVVTRAYKATPIRNLEVETAVPPLDLYLTKRRADFEERLQLTGKDKLLEEARQKILRTWGRYKIKGSYRKRRNRHFTLQQAEAHFRPTTTDKAIAATKAWKGQNSSEEALWLSWKQRVLRQPNTNLVDGIAREIFDDNNNNNNNEGTEIKKRLSKRLNQHEDLRKAQSSLLIQARTEKIGFKGFLFKRKVPEVTSPICSCGQAEETVRHVLTECTYNYGSEEELGLDFSSPAEVMRRLQVGEQIWPILKRLARRLTEYRLAQELGDI